MKISLLIIIYFLSFSSCNSANSALENSDLIFKIIEIAKRIKAKIILDRARI
ncbi:hypothetical protein [Borreliella garinii]|uniref:hypothetical protein n=1 Tax=Borreliella garinii TaxID=29519 RepID=UPI001F258C39|nr:hypothetical protein [Borreliella garinii]